MDNETRLGAGRMPLNLPERLEWAKQIIDLESEPSDLAIAAHTVLAALIKCESINVNPNGTCKHSNGWYITVRFWWIKRRFFVCRNCGEPLGVHNVELMGRARNERIDWTYRS